MAKIKNIKKIVLANSGSGADAVVTYVNEGPWSTASSVTVVELAGEFFAGEGASGNDWSLDGTISNTATTVVVAGIFGGSLPPQNENQGLPYAGWSYPVLPTGGGRIMIGTEVIKYDTCTFSGNTAFDTDYTTATLTSCTRGDRSTTAAGHTDGDTVKEILIGQVSNIEYDTVEANFNVWTSTTQVYYEMQGTTGPSINPALEPGVPEYVPRATQHLVPVSDASVTLYEVTGEQS
tara:strand:+ start:1808 stop:2512 length:705 start_codon:yes stop_codon:yes gene_type:complete